MPPQVLGKEYARLQNDARRVLLQRGLQTAAAYRGEAGMGGFFVSNITTSGVHPVLGTSGASPCLIMVVHCTNGKGALGHFAGHNNPAYIFQGIGKMVSRLTQPAPLSTIIFAGGGGMVGQLRDALMALTRAAYTTCDFRWPVPSASTADSMEDAYTAAVDFPTLNQLALFDDGDQNVTIPGPSPNSTTLQEYGYDL
jgi:hypothetical protein